MTAKTEPTFDCSPVVVRAGRMGQGVFARQSMRRGTLVGQVAGRVIEQAGYDSNYCIDLGGDRVLEPSPPFRFLNHSCRPNCEVFSWARDDQCWEEIAPLWLLVLRAVRPGEQLTIDYAWPAEAAIPCLCGARTCRRWVVAEEELPRLASRFGGDVFACDVPAKPAADWRSILVDMPRRPNTI